MKLGKKKSIEEQNLKQQASVLDYVIIVIIGIILLYPLVWMFFATFKDNSEIFGSVSLLPKVWHFENYTNFPPPWLPMASRDSIFPIRSFCSRFSLR